MARSNASITPGYMSYQASGKRRYRAPYSLKIGVRDGGDGTACSLLKIVA